MLTCKLTKLFTRNKAKHPNTTGDTYSGITGKTSILRLLDDGSIDSRALTSLDNIENGMALSISNVSGFLRTSHIVGVAHDDFTVCVGTLTQKEIMCLSTIDTTKPHRIIITNNSVYLLEVIDE